MALVKKLSKHGNSYALIFDKVLIELLGIDVDTPLAISTNDGKSLNIAPVQDEEHNEKFQKALDRANKKYGRALKNLAE